MGIAAKLLCAALLPCLGVVVAVLLTIIVVAVLYLGLLSGMRVLSKEELRSLRHRGK
jgi:hypothetical protein